MYKVLFLGWEYYPVFTGGLGVVCQALAEGMAERDIEVFVVLPRIVDNLTTTPNLKFPTNITINQVNVRVSTIYTDISLDPYALADVSVTNEPKLDQVDKHVPYRPRKQVEQSDLNASNLYGRDLFSNVYRYADVVRNLAQDIEFDLIHAHDWMTFMAAIAAKEASGKQAILHVHATEFDRTADQPNALIQQIEGDMLHQADMVVAVSNHTRQTIVNKYKLPHHKVRVLHNALVKQPENLIPKLALGDGKTVISLGRVVVQKGVENFVRIARKIVDILPKTNFIFAGDGPLLPEVMELVCDLNLHENFLFTGGVSRLKGDILYRNSDLYIMTSGSEPFGLTALEAISQETPVLIPKTSGVTEVLPNAIAVDFWDVDKYADYAINILIDNDFQQFLVNQQTNDLGKLTWSKQVDALIGIYHELLNTNKYSL